MRIVKWIVTLWSVACFVNAQLAFAELQPTSDKSLPQNSPAVPQPSLTEQPDYAASPYVKNYPGNPQQIRSAGFPSRTTVQTYLEEVPFSQTARETLNDALWKAAEKAGGMAKTVGETIGDYLREKQIEKYQQALVENFYGHLLFQLDHYQLTPVEREKIVNRIEKIYIEDGKTGVYKLDVMQFREMPALVKKEYAEITLKETQNGTVDTFYSNGNLKTRWNLLRGEPHGVVTTYYENGELLYIDHYKEGRKISRKKYDSDGKLEFEQAYDYESSSDSVVTDSQALPPDSSSTTQKNLTPQPTP